jgi:membrane-associated phospholipid phosphatase
MFYTWLSGIFVIRRMVMPGSRGVVGLRMGEKILLGFFIYATLASFVFHLSFRERASLLVLNLTVGAVIIALGKAAKEGSSATFAVLRDWLPSVLVLVAYRESGLFITPDPTHRLDYLFIRFDRWLLSSRLVLGTLHALSPWLQYYLEVAYLFCYPLVPLGIGSLYWARAREARSRKVESSSTLTASPLLLESTTGAAGARRSAFGEKSIDCFWTAVLGAVLCSYFLFPFFPLTPPRTLFNDLPGPEVQPLLRNINLWLLGKYSVQACLFPSGHVAAVIATALAVRKFLPRLGVVFIIVALSISAATVYGRYHYAADAVAGGLVALLAYQVSNRIQGKR